MARGKKTRYSSYDEWKSSLILTNIEIINLANKRIKEYLLNKEFIIRNDNEMREIKSIISSSNFMLDELCDIEDRVIKPRLRFKILKRDNFSCVYCGRRSPNVELQVDHIYPFSKGGKTEENNLVTSCRDCNIGKSNIPLGE